MYLITVSKNADDTDMGAEWIISCYRTKSMIKMAVIVSLHRIIGAKVVVSKW